MVHARTHPPPIASLLIQGEKPAGVNRPSPLLVWISGLSGPIAPMDIHPYLRRSNAELYIQTGAVSIGHRHSHRSSGAAYNRRSNAAALIRKAAQRSSSAAGNPVDHKLREAVPPYWTEVMRWQAPA